MVWNLFPFKGDFSLGTSQKLQGARSGLSGGWVTWVIWCFTKILCTRGDATHELGCCCDEAANHQLPRAVTLWIIQLVSTEEYSSLTQNLIQIHCSTRSVILNVTATQYTCSFNSIHSHPLTSVVKSLFTHVHSSPLSLAARLHWCCANCPHYINSGWTSSGQTSICKIYDYQYVYWI